MASGNQSLARQHSLLLKKIADELSPQEVERLKIGAKAYAQVRAGKISPLTDAHAVLHYLVTCGVIGIGNYQALKDLLKGYLDLPILADEVEKAERDMNLDPASSTDDAGPSTSKRAKPNPVENATRAPNSNNVESDLCDEQCYLRPAGSQGTLVIFNQFTQERGGSEIDKERICTFFKDKLNYRVLSPPADLSKAEFLSQLQTVSSSIQMQGEASSALVIVVMSHGNEDGIMTCRSPTENDGEVITVNELTKHFKGDELKKLRDKPKMFIIQACRGTVGQDGSIQSDDKSQMGDFEADVSDLRISLTTPHDADMLTAFSTTEGYKSYRHRLEGSFFVQVLVDIFQKYYKQEHVVDMLTMVNREMAKQNFPDDKQRRCKKQMPCFFSTLRKKFYLNR